MTTFIEGDILHASDLNAMLADIDGLQQSVDELFSSMPRSRGSRSDSFAIGANHNKISGYTADYNIGSGLNATTGDYVVPSTGLYAITASVNFGTSSNRRFIQVDVGTAAAGSNTSLARVEGPATGYSALTISTEALLTAGQTISLVAYSAASTNIRGDFSPCVFTIRKVA